MDLEGSASREPVHWISLLSLLGAFWPCAAGIAVERPEEYVNIIAGATGEKAGQHHSTGNTLPLTARPWGFNHWAPQTTIGDTSWWSDMEADTFHGIRCTHQPSPWIGDYGWFLLRMGPMDWLGYTSYHEPNSLRPYKIDLTLGPEGIGVELAPTNHSAVLRVRFPPIVPQENRLICVWVPRGNSKGEDEKHAKERGRPTGVCKMNNDGIDLQSSRYAGGVNSEFDFMVYARLEASDPNLEIISVADTSDCLEERQKYEPLNMQGEQRTQEASVHACQKRCAMVRDCAHFTSWVDGGCHLSDVSAKKVPDPSGTVGPPVCPHIGDVRQCCFKLQDKEEIEVRIGTSMISAAQAKRALVDEVRNHTLESVALAGQEIWRRLLSRVLVLDAGPAVPATWERLRVFYTCLYRALLFPRRLDERTPTGAVYHWSPYDGEVHDGPCVTDNGFWDTFRTVYPFLSLAYPEELGEMLEGWLNAYRAGGWLPKWASPGYRDSMVGTFADVVLADAIIKRIRGFNYSAAWEAMYKDAFVANPNEKDTSRGKRGLRLYIDKGYVPIDSGITEACSRTLDFAYADAAAAAAARNLGRMNDADVLLKRSDDALNSVYDRSSHLMGRRKASGEFKEEPPDTWGDCFTEGSAWHHSFPPFHLETLSELHGGKHQLLEKLHELFSAAGNFKVGSYRVEIHEMREMRMLGMGQYAHNNQPAHHLPYMFAALGDHNTTAVLVRQIMSRAYSSDGFSGDEDNGEMGAWFLLSALGLFAVSVGVSDNYVLGASPLFPAVLLSDLGITIEAPSAVVSEPVIHEVLWRSQTVSGPGLSYSELRNGGVLRFVGLGDPRSGDPVARPQTDTAATSAGEAADTAAMSAGEAAPRVQHTFRKPPTVELGGREGSRDRAFSIMGSIGFVWLALNVLRWLCKFCMRQRLKYN